MENTAHVSKWKEEVLRELVSAMTGNRVVGIINIGGIPSPQMQLMRKSMREKAQLIVSKNTLITIAIKEAAKQKPGLEKMLPLIDAQTAIVATQLDSFRLFKQMESTKTKAPAKGGEMAPDNIEIKKGETPFKPGPIVGEMQKVGIPAAIEGGKVVIKKDIVVVKKGAMISRDLAQMLARLEVFPLIVGLDLRGAYEDGILYKRDVLAFDEQAMLDDMRRAALQSMTLALEIAYTTKDTIKPLLQKAYRNAAAVSVEAGFPTKDTIKQILARAQMQASALAAQAKIDG